ncbi:serine hydrolase domain-containing protein [Streptomyces sp. AK02-01A]|uniref:serine hydrolase domain-containing protein n=1 Tax=Streptomyces sp. AK02-01A TaxID=3028648 RepID=UPI0029AD6467|nr:serine hydrolase domain-containing protein [Streptomyces sp. AK02-01A]MDX3852203.1 serine hydrolase [Streptomyces sp. AK02-01A]
MPLPRARLSTTVVMVLFGLGASVLGTGVLDADVFRKNVQPGRASSTSGVLARLVGPGRAPAAALLSRAAASSRFETAGSGIRRADRFRAGSITKTVVATVVLQLAAEGELELSDTVDRHLPGLVRGHGNDGRLLTLRDLLRHTSGLYDYAKDASPPAGPAPPAVLTAPTTALAAVRTATDHAPGPLGSYAYSNTDYVLLGLVIERVTGRSYAAEAQRRVIAPLGLTGTSFPGGRTTLPTPHGRAYSRAPASGQEPRDVTELDPRPAGAAGELISTLDDLDRLYTALLSGDLLPPSELRELLDTDATQGRYGMGVYPRRLSCGTTVWGHNGRIAGSYVRTAATADGRHTFSFRINTDTLADGSLDTLEASLLEAEFCRS